MWYGAFGSNNRAVIDPSVFAGCVGGVVMVVYNLAAWAIDTLVSRVARGLRVVCCGWIDGIDS